MIPRIDVIAFTGSRPVGLHINRRAATRGQGQDHVKRVIAEMGGKNAIIVDADADLDEAVVGVVQTPLRLWRVRSARPARQVIVLGGVHDAFVARLGRAGARPSWSAPQRRSPRRSCRP